MVGSFESRPQKKNRSPIVSAPTANSPSPPIALHLRIAKILWRGARDGAAAPVGGRGLFLVMPTRDRRRRRETGAAGRLMARILGGRCNDDTVEKSFTC